MLQGRAFPGQLSLCQCGVTGRASVALPYPFGFRFGASVALWVPRRPAKICLPDVAGTSARSSPLLEAGPDEDASGGSERFPA